MKLNSLDIAIIAITAALYTVLGFLFQPISFLELQFRVAELMVGMVILFPIPGLIGKVIGVFFVNMTSPMLPWDFISCAVNIPALFCIILSNKSEKYGKYLRYVGGTCYALIISIYVAWLIGMYYTIPIEFFPLNVLFIFVAESILANLGIYIFTIIDNRVDFQRPDKVE